MFWTGILIKYSIVSKVSLLLKGNKAVRKLRMKIYADRTRTCLSFTVPFNAWNHSVQGYLNDCLHHQEFLIGVTIIWTSLSVWRIEMRIFRDIYVLCQIIQFETKKTAISKMEESHEQVLNLYEVEFVHQIAIAQIFSFSVLQWSCFTLELFIPIRRHIY